MKFRPSNIRWFAAAFASAALAVTAAAPASAYPTLDDPSAQRAPAAARSNVDTAKSTARPPRGGKGKKAKKAASRRSTAPGWQGEHPPGQQPQ